MKEKDRDRNLIELLKDTQTKELDIIKKLLKVQVLRQLHFLPFLQIQLKRDSRHLKFLQKDIWG